jgi:protein TonB
MKIARRHWFLALGAAATVHAGVAAALLWQSNASSALSAGVGGIEISLGPAGGAAGSVAEAPPPVIEKKEPVEEKPEPVAAPEPPQELVEAPPIEQPDVAVKHDTVPPPPTPVDVPKELPKPPPAEPTPPQPVKAPLPPKPKPRAPEPPKKVVEPEPAPQKAPPPEPERPVTETQTASVAPSIVGVNGKAGTESSQNAGNANDTAGGGMPGQLVDYMAVLQAWLEKHKEYPRGARLRHIEGTTLLYFVMDRDGRVIDFRIQKSSGHDLLDHEVEEMIQRAQPLPQMPDSMTQVRLELVVPVQFLLR